MARPGVEGKEGALRRAAQWWAWLGREGSQEDRPENGEGAGSGGRQRGLQGGKKGRALEVEEEDVQGGVLGKRPGGGAGSVVRVCAGQRGPGTRGQGPILHATFEPFLDTCLWKS